MVVFLDSQIAGISGDMLLSALVNIGADKSKIIRGIKVAETFLSGSTIKKIDFEKVKKHGTEASGLIIDFEETTQERKGLEILDCIQKAADKLELSPKAKTFAIESIKTLMQAESKIHGEPLDSVHFHEASSIDTIIDIIGSAIAMDDLKFFDEVIITSPVAVGGGNVKFSHGVTPNPTPAVLEIFKNSGIQILGGMIKDELTTPTGACMLVNLTKSCSIFYPPLKVNAIGYGAGNKNFEEFSNVLRIIRGEKTDHIIQDSVKILETNVDDVSGELLGHLIEKIMSQGAKDVTISPGITKKGRPTNIVSVICSNDSFNSLLDLLMAETGTLGVRVRTSERYTVPRSQESISITLEGKNFTIHYKTNKLKKSFKIEADDIKQISESLNKSFKDTEESIRSSIKKKLN